jgi:hypothetical protein
MFQFCQGSGMTDFAGKKHEILKLAVTMFIDHNPNYAQGVFDVSAPS